MKRIAEARITHATYENVVVVCPLCREENTFNRASDLHTYEPIDSLQVSCLRDKCRKPFFIHGDCVNPAHEMLLFDCYELMERKNYMRCVLLLCQAYEMMFSLFLRVELLYKPFGADPKRDCAKLNRLFKAFHEKVERLGFQDMRSLFLEHITARRSPRDLNEAETAIKRLKPKAAEITVSAIDAIGDAKLARLLKALKTTHINCLRNQVVHKEAHRPTRDEAEAAFEETKSILFGLAGRIHLVDNINWYVGGALSFQCAPKTPGGPSLM